MKAKCPECGTGKARRLCHRTGHVEICSACCAGMRDPDCGDCPHYAAATRYEANRRRQSGLSLDPDGFLMEINADVAAAVDKALEVAERGELQQPMANLKDLLRCLRGYQKVVSIGPVDDPVVIRARSLLKDMARTIRTNHGVELEDCLRSAEMFEEAFELMEAEDWNGALEGFRASAALNDHSAPCHGNIGLCHANLGRKGEALAAFDHALEIDPDYEPARSNRKIAVKMVEGKPLENVNYASINFTEETAGRR